MWGHELERTTVTCAPSSRGHASRAAVLLADGTCSLRPLLDCVPPDRLERSPDGPGAVRQCPSCDTLGTDVPGPAVVRARGRGRAHQVTTGISLFAVARFRESVGTARGATSVAARVLATILLLLVTTRGAQAGLNTW